MIVTGRFCAPCWPPVGFTDNRTGVPAVTANAFKRVATSVPVVKVTFRAPNVAAGSTLRTTVALVAEVTVNDVTVIPVPKLASVDP